MRYEIQRPLPYDSSIRWIRAWGYHRALFEAPTDAQAIRYFRRQISHVKVPMRLVRFHAADRTFSVVLETGAVCQEPAKLALNFA